MKKNVILIFWLFVSHCLFAQYCGSSGSTECSSSGMPVNPGLYPPADSFTSFYNHFITSEVIQFRNFDTILFGNETLPVYSLKWDTIENLPPGLCWSTNKTDNTFGRGETGCIHISGKACGATGQYKLSTLVTVDIGIPVETDGDQGGLGYFVRLQNYGDTDIPLDTTQTDSMPFIAYGGICQTLTPPVVNLGIDQTVCAGSIVTFSPLVTGGQPPYTYLWQSDGSDIICATCSNASATITQNSEYILKVTDASGGFGYDTVDYIVAGNAFNFQITSTEPDVFCAGGTVTFSANANSAISFQWNRNGNNLLGDTTNVLMVTDSSGAYNLIYTEAGVCQATSNVVNVLFYDVNPVTITSVGSDTICIGGAVTLVANADGLGLNYDWLQDGTDLSYSSTSLSANVAGNYSAAVTNLEGCTDTSAPVLVVASPNFPTLLTYTEFTDDTFCNNGLTVTLSGGDPTGGYYSGNGVLNGIFDPSAARTGLNFVYYNYTDSTGCGSSVFDSVDVLLCTGMQTITAENDIELYPNPAAESFTVKSGVLLQKNARLYVTDISGKTLDVHYERETGVAFVDISNLAGGYYLLHLQADNLQAIQRFIKIE